MHADGLFSGRIVVQEYKDDTMSVVIPSTQLGHNFMIFFGVNF
jgi:hypothetical protein